MVAEVFISSGGILLMLLAFLSLAMTIWAVRNVSVAWRSRKPQQVGRSKSVHGSSASCGVHVLSVLTFVST